MSYPKHTMVETVSEKKNTLHSEKSTSNDIKFPFFNITCSNQQDEITNENASSEIVFTKCAEVNFISLAENSFFSPKHDL